VAYHQWDDPDTFSGRKFARTGPGFPGVNPWEARSPEMGEGGAETGGAD